jgi:hypothetical protein
MNVERERARPPGFRSCGQSLGQLVNGYGIICWMGSHSMMMTLISESFIQKHQVSCFVHLGNTNPICS